MTNGPNYNLLANHPEFGTATVQNDEKQRCRSKCTYSESRGTYHEHSSGSADVPLRCGGPVCNSPWANTAGCIANNVGTTTRSTSPLVYDDSPQLVFLQVAGGGYQRQHNVYRRKTGMGVRTKTRRTLSAHILPKHPLQNNCSPIPQCSFRTDVRAIRAVTYSYSMYLRDGGVKNNYF